MQTKLEDKVT